MTIAVGDSIPALKLNVATPSGSQIVDTEVLFGKGRKVVLFAVPGAFTPTCSEKHLPGFVANASEILSKGVDEIVCLAVNDGFVMDAWANEAGVGDTITMLPDGSATLTKALGLELDLTNAGLGLRSKRYAMIVEDGRVTSLEIDPRGLDLTSAGACLARL